MFAQYKDVLTNLSSYSKNVFRKGYFSWLFKQMTSWSKTSWALIIVSFFIQIVLGLQGLSTFGWGHTTISFLAANLSVLCVVGISNKAPIQGWFGLTSAVFIAINAFISHNFADMTLQIFYILFLDIFCILSPSWNDNVTVHDLGGLKGWVKYLLFFVVIWGASYVFYGFFNDPRLFLDSLTLAISLTGAIMEFNLLRQQYYAWMLGSIITIALWFTTALQGDANWALFASYLVFFLNDLIALFSKQGWFRNQKVVKGFGDNQETVKEAK